MQARKNLACAGLSTLSGNQISGADSLVDFHGSTAPAGRRRRPSGRPVPWTPRALLVVLRRALVPGALATCSNKEPRRRSTPPRRFDRAVVGADLGGPPSRRRLRSEGLTARVGGGGALIFAGAALAARLDSGDEAAAFRGAAFECKVLFGRDRRHYITNKIAASPSLESGCRKPAMEGVCTMPMEARDRASGDKAHIESLPVPGRGRAGRRWSNRGGRAWSQPIADSRKR